jgi:hypothetical protein
MVINPQNFIQLGHPNVKNFYKLRDESQLHPTQWLSQLQIGDSELQIGQKVEFLHLLLLSMASIYMCSKSARFSSVSLSKFAILFELKLSELEFPSKNPE